MPYYGDYYRGDYYQGDLLDLVKGGFRAIRGAVGGFVRGGVTGAVSGAVTAVVKPPMSTPPIRPGGFPTRPLIGQTPAGLLPMVVDVPRGTPGAVPQPGVRGKLERMFPGGESGYVPAQAVGGGTPSGWHWNKSHSYSRGLPAGSFLVRNRHMNPLNPRALRRAIRRQASMVVMMRRALKGSGYKVTRSGYGARKKTRRR